MPKSRELHCFTQVPLRAPRRLRLSILDKIETTIAGRNLGAGAIVVRRQDRPYADINILHRWDRVPTAALAEDLAGIPAVASVKSGTSKLSIRLDDGYIKAAGRALERGETPKRALTSPQRYLIGFLGPNTSKALHLGHLRNIILGNGLACAFKTAGFPVQSYSLVGDIGRNVCEAMAGYKMFYADTTPEQAGLKSDHFVGRCYRDYLQYVDQVNGKSDDPCGREHTPADDLADEFLRRWARNEAETRAIWRWVCSLVDMGHNETLERLGVRVDQFWRESEHVDHALALIQRGLHEGILGKTHGGMVVYETGRKEFRRIVFARSDGFPTEHARVVSVFQQIFKQFTDKCVHIDWNGTEWEPAQRVLTKFMEELSLIPKTSRHCPVFHGMVSFGGEELSSSVKDPILIDELLDRVIRSQHVARLVATSDGSIGEEAIADIVIKIFFLSAPQTSPLHFSWKRLMSPQTNPGWQVAEAWIRANAGDHVDLNEGETVVNGSYRTLVLQALGFSRDITLAARDMRLTGLARFSIHYAERYLKASSSAQLDLLSKMTLARAFGAVGILTPFSPA